MRSVLAALFVFCFAIVPASADEVRGSGSTFCFTVMSEWARTYEHATGTRIVYQPIGSSAGITEIRESIVDFAVSEMPLNDAQLLRDGLTQFPLLIGAVVPVVNIPGIGPGQLRLTGTLLADIYLGKIERWNDSAIGAVNPQLRLPNLPIVTLHRTDGSGTTFIWTSYLSQVSGEWLARVGEGALVRWPVGFGGRGNADVAAKLARLRGGLGYIDYSYAEGHALSYALVANRAGQFVLPDVNGLLAALQGVQWKPEEGYNVVLSNSASAGAYPIVGVSFAVMRSHPAEPTRASATFRFLRWALESGTTIALSRAYLPLPQAIARHVQEKWPALAN